MTKTPEHLDGIHLNLFARNAEDANYIRGSTPPAPAIEAALDQIASPKPDKQIRIIEGMGSETFSPQRIKGINKLPPGKRTVAITEIVDAILGADLVYVEEPTPPKHFD